MIIVNYLSHPAQHLAENLHEDKMQGKKNLHEMWSVIVHRCTTVQDDITPVSSRGRWSFSFCSKGRKYWMILV